MIKKLPKYAGPLTPSAIAAGMNAARENASRLAQDAKTMLDSERYPSASALATLSIEESGKSSILRSLAIADSPDEIRSIWKQYRSHTSKNALWLLPELAAKGARRLDELSPLFSPTSDHPFVLDQVKQISFYSDCLGKAHWSRPSEVIDRSLAATLVQTAQILSRGTKVSTHEIELWAKHMMPVKNAAVEWKNKALVNWYAEMQAEGLAPPGENKMEMFVFHGLNPSSEE